MALPWILRSSLLRCTLFVVIARAEEVFNTTPPTVKTSFSCLNRPMGFYADVEANCKVYHTCDDHGNKFSYRCPEETAFRQDALICDHAHLVDCRATVHPPTQIPRESVGEGFAHAASSASSPVESANTVDDHRSSFSRSFRVVQRPDSATPNKYQSGFVFRASLFLRDQDQPRQPAAADTCATCGADSRSRTAAPTARTFAKQLGSWNPRDDGPAAPRRAPLSSPSPETRDRSTVYFNRSYEPLSAAPGNNRHSPPPPREKSPPPSYGNDHHPYSETLRSIQASAYRARSTTEIPVHALTMSLKPLVPNELEYDPYYPKQPTSTEAYYTPSHRSRVDTNHVRFSSTSQAPLTAARSSLPSFEIPSVLPDLNTLEDLVDRRKFFYIPRTNAKSI